MRPMRAGRVAALPPAAEMGRAHERRKGDEWDSGALAPARPAARISPGRAIRAHPESTVPRLIALLLMALAAPTASAGDARPDLARIRGKIQFVTNFPDYKVKIVESFADLHVKVVESFPDDAGEWQMVESFPDYKIQIVESFPDFTIRYVESFPGVR